MSKQILFALTIWTAMLAATGAVADVQTPADADNRSTTTPIDAEDATIRRVLTEFRTVRVPLSRAMAIAERLHEGSKTADISFESAGSPVYRVRTIRKEIVSAVHIHADLTLGLGTVVHNYLQQPARGSIRAGERALSF